MSDSHCSEGSCGTNYSKAIVAGIVATIAMTVVMAFFGANIVKAIGTMFVGSKASDLQVYLVGGGFHLVIGIIYAFIYAWIMTRFREVNDILKGIIYGTILTVIAFLGMPYLAKFAAQVQDKAGVHNPCNPCAANPCNPCADVAAGSYGTYSMAPCDPNTFPKVNPDNPCYEFEDSWNPCYKKEHPENPCDDDHEEAREDEYYSVFQGAAVANPCNPGNPCAGANKKGMIASWISHLVYGIVLALMYRNGKK